MGNRVGNYYYQHFTSFWLTDFQGIGLSCVGNRFGLLPSSGSFMGAQIEKTSRSATVALCFVVASK